MSTTTVEILREDGSVDFVTLDMNEKNSDKSGHYFTVTAPVNFEDTVLSFVVKDDYDRSVTVETPEPKDGKVSGSTKENLSDRTFVDVTVKVEDRNEYVIQIREGQAPTGAGRGRKKIPAL